MDTPEGLVSLEWINQRDFLCKVYQSCHELETKGKSNLLDTSPGLVYLIQ